MKGKITIRISDSLRTKLSEKSEAENTSVSEVARNILENNFSSNPVIERQSILKESAQTIQEISKTNQIDNTTNIKEEEEDVVFSSEFYQLLIWMYDQKESRELKLSKEELEVFKNTVNKLQFSNVITNELKREFDKVYVDLVGMLTSAYKSINTPDFAYGYSGNSFNYKILNKFLFPERIKVNLSSFKSFDNEK